MNKHVTCPLLTLAWTFTVVGGAAWLAWQPAACIDPPILPPSLPILGSQQSNPAYPRPSLDSASALVQQARCFGDYLNASTASTARARHPSKRPAHRFEPGATVDVQAARPQTVTPRFQVTAISIYPSQPERSMALISEPGTDPRWVKCRDKVGHLSIEAIHRQQVVWRCGVQTGRVAVTTERARGNHAAALPAPFLQPAMPPRPIVQKERLTVPSPRMKSKPTARNLDPGP